MSFGRSILTLLAAAVAIGFPYFLGHGLALHETTPMLIGAGFLLVSVVLFFLLSRFGREARQQPH
ncbi:MAG: hypothetical protein WEB88_08290 [Gemmatimonadota bacterium]